MLLASCQTDYDAPDLVRPEATLKPNTTIAEFKQIFKDDTSSEVPMKNTETSEPFVLHGRVVSSDVSGNIFKSIVVQDETAAISISVNRGNLYTNFRVGQEVVINATGLWAGNYHNLVCLGWGANEYGSIVTSRMAPDVFFSHTELNGLPVEQTEYIAYGSQAPADKPYCLILPNLSTLPSYGSKEFYDLQSQLVEIPNVTFTLGGQSPFAMKEENMSVEIKDASGGTLDVRNSGYSNFYNSILPTGRGTVRGILSYYNDDWQLLLRDLDDVIFNGPGTEAQPYTVSEVIDMNNNGRTAWVQGYIVGSVKAGKSTVASADDVIFGAGAELDNTVLIASEPGCTDLGKCLIVELLVGTTLRLQANLLDHPENLGKVLAITGKFVAFMGRHGVVDSQGLSSDFKIADTLIVAPADGQ